MMRPSAAIEAVFEKNRDRLSDRIETLEQAVAAMHAGRLANDLRTRAERDAHKLAGSLGMFGLPLGSELALELEQVLAPQRGPLVYDVAHLATLVVALRAQLDGRPAGSRAAGDGDPPASDARTLLLVSPEQELIERLSVEALERSFRPRSVATSAAARRLTASEPPDAAVLDVGLTGADNESLHLLEELAGHEPPVPVLVLTGGAALTDRVELARRGGRGFLQRTRHAGQVLDAITEQLASGSRSKDTILAVDDDPAISATLEALLAPNGLAVKTLNEPPRFWQVLEEVRPDLLVLDLDMPDIDGIDLCRAVRADIRFGQLPVVFLTARADAESVQRIFEAGADDYVSKPIVGPELVTRVLNRLDRLRLYRDLAHSDSLTGLASRRKATSSLEEFAALSTRFAQPLSLALLDLDHFKALNDRLGHAAGDAALRRIGEMLLASFRGEDVVGRWGGEEFIVGMYGMARDDAMRRMSELLATFRHERFTGREGTTARVSFSAGIAEFPGDGSDLEALIRVADAALYRAKADGRDRVVLAGDGSPRPSSALTPSTSS